MLDIANLFNNDDEKLSNIKVDLSGRPAPTNVRAIIDSGFEVPCVVAYDGLQKDARGQRVRRYLVKAEIDWGRHWIKLLVVGEFPEDVHLILSLPEKSMKDALQFQHQMRTVIEKRVSVTND
jgi:hypothetical protein